MALRLTIDFVSDIACPWCVIGLKALDQALARLAPDIQAELHFRPFELNPHMGPEGEDITEYITAKYGISEAQAEANRAAIRERGAALGFTFSGSNAGGGGRSRIYNTFDAHRLLHWAHTVDLAKQKALKEALFVAYFTDGQAPSSHDVLLRAAASAGLDTVRAAEVLASGEFEDETRQAANLYLSRGIRSVPAIIINDQHLISGGHPVEVFEQALRQIAQG